MFVINNLLVTKVLVNYDLKKVLFGPFQALPKNHITKKRLQANTCSLVAL